VWRQADRYGVPRIIFANKMDRVGADFDRCLAMIRDRLTKKAYPLQLPVGSGELFTGHIDVLRRVETVFDDDPLVALASFRSRSARKSSQVRRPTARSPRAAASSSCCGRRASGPHCRWR